MAYFCAIKSNVHEYTVPYTAPEKHAYQSVFGLTSVLVVQKRCKCAI